MAMAEKPKPMTGIGWVRSTIRPTSGASTPLAIAVGARVVDGRPIPAEAEDLDGLGLSASMIALLAHDDPTRAPPSSLERPVSYRTRDSSEASRKARTDSAGRSGRHRAGRSRRRRRYLGFGGKSANIRCIASLTRSSF